MKAILCLLLLYVSPVWALDRQLSDADQIRQLDDLTWEYINSDMEKAVQYSKQGLTLAERAQDDGMRATFYRNIGVAYYMGSVFDSARHYLDRALPLAVQEEDDRLTAAIYVAYGNLYNAQSWYRGAADYYLEGLTIMEKMENYPAMALTYGNLGGLYQRMRNFTQALKYLEKSHALALQMEDQATLAAVNVSLADITMTMGEPMEISKAHAEEAIRLNKEVGNAANTCVAYLTLAKVYYYHDDVVTALPLAQRALKMAEETGFPSIIAHAQIVLSNIQLQMGHYDAAIASAQESLNNDTTDSNIVVNIYANLALAYAYTGQPELTTAYFDQYRERVNHYANMDYQTSMSEMEVLFETERKEFQIEHLERERGYYLRMGIAIGLLTLVVVAFLVIGYRLAVSRRRLAEEEARRLERENQLIAVQATLDGEAAERSRLARDLHDGLGSMLAVVKFNLPPMDKGAVIESLDVERFQRALGLLDDSIQELRRVAHHMMPESLLRYGLKASLADFCQSVPNVNFHYFGDETRLPEKVEVLVYRCIHELVNNAWKHAEADQINVQLVQEQDRVSFTVQDDGVGFDHEEVKEGMGLKNIRQRVASFNGEMSVYSSDKGTEVHVELDLTTSN